MRFKAGQSSVVKAATAYRPGPVSAVICRLDLATAASARVLWGVISAVDILQSASSIAPDVDSVRRISRLNFLPYFVSLTNCLVDLSRSRACCLTTFTDAVKGVVSVWKSANITKDRVTVQWQSPADKLL